MTGTYTLQVNRAKFNQSEVDPTCMLCRQDPETTEHFLLTCPTLEDVRRPLLEGVLNTTHKLIQGSVAPPILLQLILDCSGVLGSDRIDDYSSPLRTLERQSISYCHALHTERYQRLSVIPKRKR